VNIASTTSFGPSTALRAVDSQSVESHGTDDARIYRVKRQTEVLGFIAIDSSVGGRSRGGLRMLPDPSEIEIRAGARAMTLKYGFLALPQGGAKAAVLGDAEGAPQEKRERLLQFARAAESLLRDRVYVPDADMGTGSHDIRLMLESIGLSISPRDWNANRSGYYTAVSCLASAQAVLESRGLSLAGSRVAIEGFGAVGSSLADLFRRRGATVVAVSTSRGALYDPAGLDVDELLQRSSEMGSRCVEGYASAQRLDRGALLELPVDLLCPCARYHSIHADNVSRVAAAAVCAGANNPVSPEAERVLFERGVSYPPDFVTNCGGVLGGTLEFAGVRPTRIASFVEYHLKDAVGALLREADRQAIPPRAIAEPLALARHERMRSAEQPGIWQRVFALGLDWYRLGWLPRALVASLAPTFMEKRLLH
jgi:glutamate dehydrogenase/leucine dehydrogenase